jgi:hypothetical protein
MSKRLTQIVNRDLHNDTDEPDHIYVDFSIVNNQPNGLSVPLQFTDLRSTSIVENPCDYYVAVARFKIDTIGLPVMIPLIQVGQSNPNLTVYSFTLAYNDNVFQQYLTYAPENANIQTPSAPLTNQDMTTKYYFVSSFMYFVDLLNDTLKSAFDGLKNLAGDLPSTIPPFILYDSTTGQMVLNVESSYDVKANQDPIYIYANPQMYNLLSGFEWLNQGATQPSGQNYRLHVFSLYNTNVYVQPDGTQLIQSYEEYNSIINWCPIQCLTVTSSSLPLSQTIINDPVQFNSLTNMTSSSSNISSPILTDFTVALDTGKEYLGSVNYTAPAQYRLIDLFGHGNVKQINLSVIWKDIYSNSYQFELASGCSANLKLLFRNKAFNKSNNI